ncbi:hypothetical protein L249_1295 [Ophiocordyceps polyrhachis-furcata BCC 54312]|uniref:Sm domain-containing protein n=1 Tax=Ophiocordyceps polyrhachis-furcata BCC 54312 TaxID=1330021 RepID=A0A367LDA6_9HYPO|nr:hypothetical protein L249_1295 [Ophiocordyceps polyrhachis-furcata BCC 54312]
MTSPTGNTRKKKNLPSCLSSSQQTKVLDGLAMDHGDARAYLTSLLNKNLRITTTDGRLFWGAFKCTDANQNIVLSHTYEYRKASGADPLSLEHSLRMDVAAARYLGLVVVPGEHIVRMELEQFVSQMRQKPPSRLPESGQETMST